MIAAILTRLPVTPCSCGLSLSGGIDTYGDIGEAMCFACWQERNEQQHADQLSCLREIAQFDADLKNYQEKRRELYAQIESAREEMQEAQSRIMSLQDRLNAVDDDISATEKAKACR